ncbi:DUF885 family protein [Glaciecola sp. SC05]|uniref:DUF885 domain-containing protein n=1 Tax=Glaciecola sp. SC05 TaxID=1987355 RepID=UPI003529C12A
MNKLTYLATIATMCIGLAACSQPQNTSLATEQTSQVAAQQAEDARLVTFLDDIFDRNVKQSPNYQSVLGIDLGGLDKWTDNSDAARAERIAQMQSDQAALVDTFDRSKLSTEGQLNYDIALAKFEADINEMLFNRHVYVADQFYGQYMGPITLLKNNHTIESVEDANNYIARLKGIKPLMMDMTARMQDRAEIGVIPPAFSFPDMVKDIGSVLAGQPLDNSEAMHPLYSDFKDKVADLDILQSEKDTLIEQAVNALKGPFAEGYQAVLDETLKQQSMQDKNVGVWALPDGKNFYDMRVRRFTTLDLSAEEVHNIGLADVETIHAELREIMETIEFEGSLQDFFEFIRNDPNNYYPNTDEGREAFLQQARDDTDKIFAIADQYFHTLPKAEFEVKRVEPWRENSTSIAFYNRPSQDGTRPGIYYANLADMASVQKYVFRSITFHEGVPGHHFQIARTQEFENVPKMRQFGGLAVFTEGWALYAERLASEMGMSEEPLYNAGRLQSELWRAVRLVVDTGIHHKQWTRQEAIDYFATNTPISELDIITEVERYFVLPGQALSYKIGMNTMLDLRDQAKQALGEKFDIRDFHEVLIGAGVMPMPLLNKRVEAYIAKVKSS